MINLKEKIVPNRQKRERIAKCIASSGLCSRRDAENMINNGRVKLNGVNISTSALTVTSSDTILVDNKKLPQIKKPILWRIFKERYTIISHKDEKGRRTLFDDLPLNFPRVISVGRLDFQSEGLLILTNNGSLARYLELPSSGWKRVYDVYVTGILYKKKLESIQNGIVINGIYYAPIKIKINYYKNNKAYLTIILSEGKNREIRRLLNHIELNVLRLMRVSYGPFHIGNLKPGQYKQVSFCNMQDALPRFFKS